VTIVEGSSIDESAKPNRVSDRRVLVVVRGGGDLGTGTAWRLHRSGFPVIVLDIERPLAIRRTVAFSTAVTEGSITVEGVEGVLVGSPAAALDVSSRNGVAVLVGDTVPDFEDPPQVVIDARLAKEPLDTDRAMAPLVIGLGPGFTAGEQCDAVIETNRGHRLGRVIWEGSAQRNTAEPGSIGGESSKRVIRADRDGDVRWQRQIADVVSAGDRLGSVQGVAVTAPIGGVVRGLIDEGPVKVGLKIGDIDPRGDPAVCFEISDKSRSVAGGVLEAVMTWLNQS
jgi:xanthine dehydrogenase accessory factor